MRAEGRLLILIAVVLVLALVVSEVLFFTGDGPRWRASLTVAGLALALVLVTATALFLRYRSLPQVKEKRALESQQAHVQRELETVRAELESIEGTRWAIEQQERADLDRRRAVYDEQAAGFAWRRHMIGVEEKEEVKAQLGRLQAWHVARGLGSSQIFHAAIPGVGRTLKSELAAAGVETAADVSYERVVAVRGFGRAKANAVVVWREDLERELGLDKPDRLPPEFEAEIKREFDRRRAELAVEEQAAAADLVDDLQAIERDAAEYYVRSDLREERAVERLAVLERQNAELASQLGAYTGVHPPGYVSALLAPGPGQPGSLHRLLRVAVPLVFVASLFCQGSAALRALATMTLKGEPLLAPAAVEATASPEVRATTTRSPAANPTTSPHQTSGPTQSPRAGTPGPAVMGPASEQSPAATGGPVVAPEASETLAPTVDAAPTAGSPGADLVLAFNAGPGAQARYLDANALLGDPDSGGRCCQGMVQLGRSGSVLLAFADNAIVDGPGADFRVRGESAGDDWLTVEVSDDGALWYSYPRLAENSGGLDLADVDLAAARFVRLTDLQPSTPTGAEVDAVVALNSGPPAGSLPSLPDAVARLSTPLRGGPGGSEEELGAVSKGAELTVLGYDAQGRWVKVRTEWGEEGWCRVADLGLNVTLEDYP